MKVLSASSRVPERDNAVRCIRWIAQKTPLVLLPSVMSLWRFFRVQQNQWGKDWRAVVQDMMHWKSSQRTALVLSILGASSLPDHSCWKYRPPLWWGLAVHGNDQMLNWAHEANHIQIEQTSSDLSFLYLSVVSGNIQAMIWGLKNGMNPNGMGPDQSPIICSALKRSRPHNSDMIKQLLFHGACWYHVGSSGESAASYSQLAPEWEQWFIHLSLNNKDNPRRKSRLM